MLNNEKQKKGTILIDSKLVLFESHPDFSDNSRALYEYMQKNTDYKCVWLVHEKSSLEILDNIGVPCYLLGSKESDEVIEKARFILSTSFELANRKKRGQIHVSLWHGFGTKLVGFFDEAAPSGNFEELMTIVTQCDLITSTSRSSQMIFSAYFASDPRKIAITGFPRNDYLFSEDGRKNLKALIGKELDGRLIFYLPTMRRGLKAEGRQFDDNLFNFCDYSPDSLELFLEDTNSYIITKLHFADDPLFSFSNQDLPKRIIVLDTSAMLSKQMTIYHILNAFDCLVTDYSSIYSDFMLLDRPIIFSCPDYNEYEKDRGFIAEDPRFMMPGAFVKNQKELMRHLRIALEGQDECKRYRRFMLPYFHRYSDDKSSERVFNKMIKMLECNLPDCHKDYSNLYVSRKASLSQYTGRCEGKLYFDNGKGFNEEEVLTVVYNLDDTDAEGYVELLFKCPYRTVKSMRFDLDSFNRMAIQDFLCTVDGVALEYFCPNSVTNKDQIVFFESYPQFVFDLREMNNSEKERNIVIKFKPIDLVYEGSVLLAKAQQELNEIKNELSDVYNSNSRKITKPLRAIKKN